MLQHRGRHVTASTHSSSVNQRLLLLAELPSVRPSVNTCSHLLTASFISTNKAPVPSHVRQHDPASKGGSRPCTGSAGRLGCDRSLLIIRQSGLEPVGRRFVVRSDQNQQKRRWSRGYRRDSGERDDAHEGACVHGGGSACDAVNMRDVLSAGNEAQCVFARVCVGRAYLCLRTAHNS